jgi:DNA-binding MarR family transcriptional regulator
MQRWMWRVTVRDATIRQLYEGLAFVSRQSRELGTQLHPELPLVAHSLLIFIDTEPEPRAVDVAAAYGLEKSTVSRQLAHLEDAGLVRRVGEKPGRRGQVLQLTDEGSQTLARSVASSQTTLADHLRDWDDDDLDDLARLLTRFVETSRRARRA